MAGKPFGGAAPPFRKGSAPRDMSDAGKSGGSGSGGPSGPPSSSSTPSSGGSGGSGSNGSAGSGGFAPGKLSNGRRKALAKTGHAMSDGSFPITDVKSLRDATHAIGRAGAAKRPAVAKHIVKHGRRLGAMQHAGEQIRKLAGGK